MQPLNSSRLAWSVAFAALALWATGARASFGQDHPLRLFSHSAIASETELHEDPAETPVAAEDEQVCLPVPGAEPTVTSQPVASASDGDSSTFRICDADPAVASAIEHLVAGRSFTARLVSRGDGCAELTVTPRGQISTGSASSRLSVGLGGGRTITISIVSANGTTSASIGG